MKVAKRTSTTYVEGGFVGKKPNLLSDIDPEGEINRLRNSLGGFYRAFVGGRGGSSSSATKNTNAKSFREIISSREECEKEKIPVLKSSKSKEIIICNHPRAWDFFGRSEVPKEDLKQVRLPLQKDPFCQKCQKCFDSEEKLSARGKGIERISKKGKILSKKKSSEKNTVMCSNQKVCGNGDAAEISTDKLKLLNLPSMEDSKCLECRKCPMIDFLLLLRKRTSSKIEEVIYFCPNNGRAVEIFRDLDDRSEPEKCPSCGKEKGECNFGPTVVTIPLSE